MKPSTFSWDLTFHPSTIKCALIQKSQGNKPLFVEWMSSQCLCCSKFPQGKTPEKAMAPHSSTLAWKIPWMEEPGGLQSTGSRRVGHNWVTSLTLFTFVHWRKQWQPTPVFLPEESQGQGSLVGCRLWGHTESEMTEVTQQQQGKTQTSPSSIYHSAIGVSLGEREQRVLWRLGDGPRADLWAARISPEDAGYKCERVSQRHRRS